MNWWNCSYLNWLSEIACKGILSSTCFEQLGPGQGLFRVYQQFDEQMSHCELMEMLILELAECNCVQKDIKQHLPMATIQMSQPSCTKSLPF